MRKIVIFTILMTLAILTFAFAEKKDSGYSLELISVKQKLRTIGEIKALTGCTLKEAKQMLEDLPAIVMENVSKDESEEAARRLSDTGAQVTVVEPAEEEDLAPPYLYVLTARNGLFDGDTLVLNQIPFVVYSSISQEEGHISLGEFFKNWGVGTDDFNENTHKAKLTIYNGKGDSNIVLEVSNPVLKGDIVSCTVKVLDGEVPGSFGPCSLYIDKRGDNS